MHSTTCSATSFIARFAFVLIFLLTSCASTQASTDLSALPVIQSFGKSYYSDLLPAGTFLNPDDSATRADSTISPNLPGGIFARQRRSCPYGPTAPICPGGRTCCSNTQICIDGGCCAKQLPVRCGSGGCIAVGSVCCGTYACMAGTECHVVGPGYCCLPGQTKNPRGCGPLEVPKKFRAADCKTFRRRADVITEKGTAYPLLARQTSTVQCTRVPHSSGGNLPVITFLNIPGVTDEFIKSMCNGMNDHYHRQKVGAPAGHKILTDPSKGEDVLRYTGSSKQYKENYCNRRAVKCRTAGGCPAASLSRGMKVTCDEYPPASAMEGGGMASLACIPEAQNTNGGVDLGRFLSKCKVNRNNPYLLRIQGGCGHVLKRNSLDLAGHLYLHSNLTDDFSAPSLRRDIVNTTINVSGKSSALIESMTLEDPSSYVAIELGELSVGVYNLTVSFDATPEDVVIVDNSGEMYAFAAPPSDSGSGTVQLNFEMPNDVYAPAILYATTPAPLTLSFNGTISPLPGGAEPEEEFDSNAGEGSEEPSESADEEPEVSGGADESTNAPKVISLMVPLILAAFVAYL